MFNRLSPLIRYNLILIFGFLLIGALYFSSDFLIPVTFAALLSMLMLPIQKKFEQWGIHKGIASVLNILILILGVALVIFILSTQVISFAEDLPEIRNKLINKLNAVQKFIENYTNVSPESQIEYLKERSASFVSTAGSSLRSILVSTTGSIATASLVVIYFFFFLYYRESFKAFLLRITSRSRHGRTRTMLRQISRVTQKYLTGLLIVVVILAILNSVGLMIIGIKHAIFFGVLAGMLNIIPYIGTFIGGTLPVIMALLTEESLIPAILVIALFSFVQFLENNFLTPNIVGSQVKIKPLFTIMVLILGGMLWGVAGMILFIPLLGVVKVILDNVENLKPYGLLIGEEEKPEEITVEDVESGDDTDEQGS